MVVRVFGNTCLNPDAVGKLEMEVSNENYVRTTTTRVFDLTGQHVLFEAKTTIATDDSAMSRDPLIVKRDNQIHAHIRAALRERRDAATWEEIDAALKAQL